MRRILLITSSILLLSIIMFVSTSTAQDEEPEESFQIIVSSIAPSIFEEIVFFAQIESKRLIDLIEWDFGDGSEVAIGHQVSHIYEEGASTEFPYRVKMTIHFADSQGPESIFRTLALPVSDTPTPGSCPPDSVVVQIFARDTVFQTSSTGCATADIADHLVSIDGELARGNAELTFDYEWEALPENTQARAILSISYIDENDTPIERDLINLTEESGGKYSLRELIEVPEVTSAEFAVSFIVFDNRTSKLISLVINPITLTFESE